MKTNAWLAFAAATVTVVIAAIYDLPIGDPDGASGPSYIRMPLVVVVVLAIDVVVRAALAAWRRGVSRAVLVDVVRDRLSWPNLRFTLVGLVSWYVVYASMRNLKSFVPEVNGRLDDHTLDVVDRAFLFGHRPGPLLQEVLGTGWAAHVLSFSYLTWIALVPLSLAVSLVWIRHARISTWWITAVSFDWLLGVALNYLVPTVGPIYVRPQDFSALAGSKTAALQDSMWSERLAMLADPHHADLQNIAAFASLHVAVVVTACVIARRAGLPRVVLWALRGFLVLTCLGTVYFGWHYLADVVAGLALGAAGAWLAEITTRGRDGAEPAQEREVQSSVRRTFPVAVRGRASSRS